MELWRLKRQYRALARRLRRPGIRTSAGVERAEHALLEALWRVERYESELSVRRFERRCAQARLARALEALERSALFKHAPVALARATREDALERWAEALQARGLDAKALQDVLVHAREVEARLAELERRVRNTTGSLAPLLQTLLNWVRADGILSP